MNRGIKMEKRTQQLEGLLRVVPRREYASYIKKLMIKKHQKGYYLFHFLYSRNWFSITTP